jgi:hypothetical protein
MEYSIPSTHGQVRLDAGLRVLCGIAADYRIAAAPQ